MLTKLNEYKKQQKSKKHVKMNLNSFKQLQLVLWKNYSIAIEAVELLSIISSNL